MTARMQEATRVGADLPGFASAPSDQAVQFLVELAEALTQAGEPEGFVQPRIAQMAAAYRVPAARVVVCRS